MTCSEGGTQHNTARQEFKQGVRQSPEQWDTMKLYVHYEPCEEGAPAFTKRVLLDDDQEHGYTLQQLLQDFILAYNTKFAGTASLESGALQLLDSNQKLLPLSAKVRKVLADFSDVFVQQQQQQQGARHDHHQKQPVSATPAGSTSSSGKLNTQFTPTQQQHAPSLATEPTAKENPEGQLVAPTCTGNTVHSNTTSSNGDGSSSSRRTGFEDAQQAKALGVLQQQLQHAEQAIKSQNFRAAAETYQEVLKIIPDAVEVLQRLACLYLQLARMPHLAEPHARRLASRLPGSSVAHQLLGDCLMALDRPRDAAKSYNAALLAAHAEEQSDASGDGNMEADLKVALARALYACGQQQQDESGVALHEEETTAFKDTAAKLVMDVLASQERHTEGLKLYARIAEAQGMTADALQVALRLVVAREKDADVHALLARRLQDDQGISALYKELSVPPSAPAAGPASKLSSQQHTAGSLNNAAAAAPYDKESMQPAVNNAAALAFLANCVKDHSAVHATITLLTKALELDPMHAGYALNLSHAWELEQRLDKTVQVAGRMFACMAGMSAGGSMVGTKRKLGGNVDLQECAQLMLKLPPLEPCVTSTAWLITGLSQHDWQACHEQLLHAQNQPKPAQVQYSSMQLDLLALAFTAAKALYVGGALQAASKLARLILPARDASQQALHTTLIRNEAAYFGCVCQLLSDFPPALPSLAMSCWNHATTAGTVSGSDTVQEASAHLQALNLDSSSGGDREHSSCADPCGMPVSSQADYRPLYLVGDSHCLSGAWREVTLRGQRRVLHPVLVTGCKIWHLRPDSTFYPKAQFNASMAALPKGSQVVLILGEIDCREGLLLAVQKCKYDTVDEGIGATLEIYLAVVMQLVQQRGMEVFIHPVPPVLQETRPMVMAFNAALRMKVQEAAANPASHGRLHFLDFSEELLSSDSGLCADFQFDGTHLSPAYMPVLASHLARVPCLGS